MKHRLQQRTVNGCHKFNMAGTPPRKFAEKIRALEERGEQDKKNFNQIIEEIETFKNAMASRHNASHLSTMSQPYRGRSLPNVNQMAQGPVPIQIPVTHGVQDGIHQQVVGRPIANYLERGRSIGDPYHGYSPHAEYRAVAGGGQMRNGPEYLLSPPPDSNNSWRRAVSDSDIRRTVEPLNGIITLPTKNQIIENNAQIKTEPLTPSIRVDTNHVPITPQPDFAGGRSLPDLTVFEYPQFPKSEESDGNFSSPYSTSPQASPYPTSPSHSPTMIGDVGAMSQQQPPPQQQAPPHRGSSPGPAPSPTIRRRTKRINLPPHLSAVGGRSHQAQKNQLAAQQDDIRRNVLNKGILPDHSEAFQQQCRLVYPPNTISWNDPASPVRHTCRHNSPAHLNAGLRGLSLSNHNGPLPLPLLNQEKSENGASGSIDGYYTADSGESPVRFDTPQTPLTPNSVVPEITLSDYSMAQGLLGSVEMDWNQPPLCEPSEPSTDSDLMRDLSSAITVDDSLFTGELATLGPVELEILEGAHPVSDSSTEDQFRLEKCRDEIPTLLGEKKHCKR